MVWIVVILGLLGFLVWSGLCWVTLLILRGGEGLLAWLTRTASDQLPPQPAISQWILDWLDQFSDLAIWLIQALGGVGEFLVWLAWGLGSFFIVVFTVALSVLVRWLRGRSTHRAPQY